MERITNLFDEYALSVFRTYTDEQLVEKHKVFTDLRQTQLDNQDPAGAQGAKAMADLVQQVQRERGLDE